MAARLNQSDAEILRAAHGDLHDALAIIALVQEAIHAATETEIDTDGLSSPHSRTCRALQLVEVKLRTALLALGEVV